MMERLMNQEHPYGEPEYSRLSEEIAKLKTLLCGQLDTDGKRNLDQLSDIYVHQETAVLRDAFSEGFWTAVELVQEYERWKRKARP